MCISYVSGFLCLNTDDIGRAKRGLAPLPNANPSEFIQESGPAYVTPESSALPKAVILDISAMPLVGEAESAVATSEPAKPKVQLFV